MNRDEAVSVVKEIFDSCKFIEGKNVKLMAPDANNVLSKGCQIHIDSRNDTVLEMCLERLAGKNGLATAKEGQLFVIYKHRQC